MKTLPYELQRLVAEYPNEVRAALNRLREGAQEATVQKRDGEKIVIRPLIGLVILILSCVLWSNAGSVSPHVEEAYKALNTRPSTDWVTHAISQNTYNAARIEALIVEQNEIMIAQNERIIHLLEKR